MVRERRRADDGLAVLEPRLVAYPDGPLRLSVANCSSHTAQAVHPWRTAPARLRLDSLPKYGSPWNPVERLGLRLKNTWAAHRLYGSRWS